MNRSHSSRRGVLLVLGLLGFGLLLTGTLYVYITLHRGPFRELTVALEDEFPGSAPHVEGGKRRLDQPGEWILRVIMRIPAEADTPRASQALAERIARFIASREDLERFDILEIHLYRLVPEENISRRTFRFTVAQTQSLSHNRDAPNRRE